MERIMVIGCCGAGKSTFSKKINAVTGVELFHLDQYYWLPDWQEPKKEEWEGIVRKLAARSNWIMDGNYGGTMSIRTARADTIIWLDYSTSKCLWRVLKRTLKNWRTERPDMPPGCRERFDWKFFRYVATFNRTRRPGLLKMLNSLSKEKEIFIFGNEKEADAFLDALR